MNNLNTFSWQFVTILHFSEFIRIDTISFIQVALRFRGSVSPLKSIYFCTNQIIQIHMKSPTYKIVHKFLHHLLIYINVAL